MSTHSRLVGLGDDYNAIFPFSTLSDKELSPFWPDRGYSSHRSIYQSSQTSFKNPTSPALMARTDVCPLRFIDVSTLRLVEFNKEEIIPPYAILSHRWTEEEVVYKEFLNPEESRTKMGYQKILGACRQALQDDIHLIWVDTCCINQGDPADIAANITSMYAYYQNAEVCYVYLNDVIKRRDICYGRNEFGQMGSDWLKRGWTMQELIAPRTVIFFNQHWMYLGDKHQLREGISAITYIPLSILSGEQSLQDIDDLTRMSWATNRVTTKPQDKAYCLQGLFGVTLVPDYEEDMARSFNRLGEVLCDAHPELIERLGIPQNFFDNPGEYEKVFL
ncbi:hypothetical protein D9758_009727 [Tetrapyrgos nigripes]|uniref:Heterokaryon incompatibility domain-containing protein n=1 Tax=Tetrapyrgos nigripes TaxID=182062 RepID=A0A8H5GKL1_9AGAR|nr:hypothetical protein D9758_009727 [Tetrapyrgos nigripes]